MAQTETRPGFKLPWTTDRAEAGHPVEEADAATTVEDVPTPEEELVTKDMIDTNTAPTNTAAEAPADAPAATPAPARRPTKFMADLSRAMQTAAESSRDETLARLKTDAKTVVDEIQAGSAIESAALRRRADDDVAAVREWSKAEIARVRDETEARIGARKVALDGELEDYAGVVEARVRHVTARVEAYETLMATFFERLMAEEDPSRIATMAEAMPDPPDLAGEAASIPEPTVEPFDPVAARMAAWAAPTPNDTETKDGAAASGAPDAPEAADAEPETGEGVPAEADFAAAEAEASAFSGDLDNDDGLASLADRGSAPSADPVAAADIPDRPASGERVTARVVVLGLVSVASIATFKRSLGRVAGVSAIGVASGPDGEFVFTVSHDAGLGLAEAIVALPGFDAHITAESADGLEVAAHDPDAGA